MTKIALVTHYFPSSAEPWQGRSAYQRLLEMSKRAEVCVFYPHAAYPDVLRRWTNAPDNFDAFYSPPEVNVRYYDYPALPVLSRPCNGWMAARALLPHVRNFAPDVIYSYVLYPDGYAALQIGKALGVPVLAESIGSDVNRISNPIVRMHTRTVLREADFLTSVSEDMRKKMVSMGAAPEKTRAIVNGCDLSVFHVRDRKEARGKLGVDSAAEVVVYVGRMDIKKGLRELVQAAASLHPSRPQLQVYMVGDGPDKGVIEQEIQAADASSYVHIMKGCSFDEVAVWMAASNLFTLPSYMEGCPNVVVEALACGRPVVASRVGGIPEVMDEESGRFVAPRQASDLARGLNSALDAQWDEHAISAKWSRGWSVGADIVLDVLDSVIAKRKAAKSGG
jgi:glycosyltransferase involved in cell wall biosynthesis